MVRFVLHEMHVVSKYVLLNNSAWSHILVGRLLIIVLTCDLLVLRFMHKNFVGVSPEKVHIVHSDKSYFVHVYSCSIFWRILYVLSALHVLSASSSLISVPNNFRLVWTLTGLRDGRAKNRDSIPGMGKPFFYPSHCPDQFWGPWCILVSGYRTRFPRG